MVIQFKVKTYIQTTEQPQQVKFICSVYVSVCVCAQVCTCNNNNHRKRGYNLRMGGEKGWRMGAWEELEGGKGKEDVMESHISQNCIYNQINCFSSPPPKWILQSLKQVWRRENYSVAKRCCRLHWRWHETHPWKGSAKVSGISGETEYVTISRTSLFPLEILLGDV